jgi:hypothetical protein
MPEKSMHDNNSQSDVELIDLRAIAETPIHLCTLSEILAHLRTRFDAVVLSAMNHGDEIPHLVCSLGPKELRDDLMNWVNEAHYITPDINARFPV